VTSRTTFFCRANPWQGENLMIDIETLRWISVFADAILSLLGGLA
jgi:hypothetical protein